MNIDLDLSNVSNIRDCFSGCISLNSFPNIIFKNDQRKLKIKKIFKYGRN